MGVGIVIVVAVIVVIALFCIHLSNNIVRLSNRCDNAWDQINAQLKRRADLIPNLVETVKGYASHESGTLEAVIAARNGVVKATTPDEVMASASCSPSPKATPSSRQTPTSSSSRISSRRPRTRSSTLARASMTACSCSTTPSRRSPAACSLAAVPPRRALRSLTQTLRPHR